MTAAITIAVLLLLVCGAALGLLRVDRRALLDALATAVLLVCLGAYVALLFAL